MPLLTSYCLVGSPRALSLDHISPPPPSASRPFVAIGHFNVLKRQQEKFIALWKRAVNVKVDPLYVISFGRASELALLPSLPRRGLASNHNNTTPALSFFRRLRFKLTSRCRHEPPPHPVSRRSPAPLGWC